MNRLRQLLNDNLIMILISIFLFFQNIYGYRKIWYAITIALMQVIRIIISIIPQIRKYFHLYAIIQYWAYLLLMYFGSTINAISILAICNLRSLFQNCIQEETLQLQKLKLLHRLLSDCILVILLSIENYNQIYFAIVPIIMNWILICFDFKRRNCKQKQFFQGDANDKIVIDSGGQTANHSRIILKDRICINDTPRLEKDFKLEILNIFPQGVGLFKISEQPIEAEYCNQNILKLLNATCQSQIIEKLFQLEKQQITDNQNKKPSDQKSSMSSFSTFHQSTIPSTSFQLIQRNEKRSQTNKLQCVQKIENILKQTSMTLNPEALNLFAKKNFDNQQEQSLIEQQLITLISQMKKPEYITIMKSINQSLQEYVAIYAQQPSSLGRKKRTLEIKFYNALLSDQPYILILIRDITHRDYIQAFKEYSKQKSQTLNFVSHEYRTPLNCIISMLEQGIDDELKYQSQTLILEKHVRRSLKTNTYQGKIEKQMKIALDNAKYLLNLSDDLLDLAQIKVGKFKIFKTKFNFNQLLESCVDLFQVTAEKKQIKLFVAYEHNVPRFIFSDSNRLKQVIINLLGNAFKFTEQGSVTIKVSICNSKLEVVVTDTGIGMTEEDQAKIFQAFGKGNSEEHKKLNRSGVGLGLLISNQILQNLNQDMQSGLKFRSQFQKGSTFYFQISYQDKSDIYSLNSLEERNQNSEEESIIVQPQEDCIHKVYVHNVTSIFKRSTKAILVQQILIVDDVCLNIEILKQLLRKFGIDQVDEASNGYSAIDKCEKRWQANPDYYKLILMDLEMPLVDGITASKKILQLAIKFNIKVSIIACSAYDNEEQKQECIQAGMKDYLTKPITSNNLQRILQQYL